MARAGATLVGVNCLFDPFITLENLKKIKTALDSADLKPFLMVQPLGYRTPDGGHFGWVDLDEFPYGNSCILSKTREGKRGQGKGKGNQKRELEMIVTTGNGKCITKKFPAVEPRQITRFEAGRFAREAYDLGARYIGGCCGFEPYHIRAVAEELSGERGGLPEGSDMSDHDLSYHRRKAEQKGRPEYVNK